MPKARVEDIRNVAICGHGSSGKTTLSDTILIQEGIATGHHSVDDGSSICDFDPEEKNHKYSIESTLAHFDHKGKRFNWIDTPGRADFVGQTLSALYGVDMAVVVVNAHAGVEVNTRRDFDDAGRLGLGRMILINKMDADNIDFPKLVEDIRDLWGSQCVLLNVPNGHGDDFSAVYSTLNVPDNTAGALMDPAEIHAPLLESIIEVDEEVMERYLEGTPPTEEELSRLIVRSVAEGSLIPIVCAAGKKNIGVEELLDALVLCGLHPFSKPRTAMKDGEEIEIQPDPDGPLIARVFKTRIDPFVQKLSFIRMYSGHLKRDEHIEVSSVRKGLKLGAILEVQTDHTDTIEIAGPGEIIALAKMDDLHTGDVLGDYELPPMDFPTPMVGLAVSPRTRGDETKLSGALHKVVEEDPTFHLDRDNQTKELVVTGMSEMHLKVVQERLARRDKLEVDTKEPKIPLRETIQAACEDSYRHKKQTGGRGQFGEVHIRMMPFPRGTDPEEFCTKSRFPSLKSYHHDEEHNFLWVDSVVGGTIPHNFMPAIEKGFKERLESGVIAGYQVQDVCVEVHFGKFHPVDSSEAAFKTAGRMVFKKAFEKSKPVLLEPIVHLDITVHESHVGDVYSDLSSRGGQVMGADAAGGDLQTVHAEAPLRAMQTYARTLSSMTGGDGSYEMKFSHYQMMPSEVQREIVSKAQMHEEEDED
ncbi:elongation factor G [Lignipirellula cremea]|uniref:Elongation factor G n=1 Tax=Lignipirellula cremea TaxID=2528010 RepID=A0A518E343_9BACT|nr:elongation factor G [Lignipirellula cremea]QDU98511.1 Elongation factor G [Lignipirellula cremea]